MVINNIDKKQKKNVVCYQPYVLLYHNSGNQGRYI